MRASAICLLFALAAGCEPTPAQAPPASAQAVALVQGKKLDRTIVLAMAPARPWPARPAHVAACIEMIDLPEVSESIARALDAGMSKEDIAGVLAFHRTPHGKKFADVEWALKLKQIEGTWTVMPELTDDEIVAVNAYKASPQHARFVAAVQAAAGTNAHDSLAKPIIEKCQEMK